MRKKVLKTFFSIFILTGILWGVVTTFPQVENFRVVPLLSPSPMIAVPSNSPMPGPISSPSPRQSHFQSVAPQRSEAHSRDSVLLSRSWDRFTQKFGTHLAPEFSKDGYLVAVRGKVGE